MALSTYALVSLSELKDSLRAEGKADDATLERVINRASRLIEQEVGAELVTRGSLTEFHTVRGPDVVRIRLRQWPITAVTSIHEDSTRTYAAGNLLTVNTDYVVSATTGEIFRVVAASGPRPWLPGWRAIKVVYTGGYANTAAVPEEYKEACLEVAAAIYYEAVNKRQGVSAVQDAHGSVTRHAGVLSQDLQKRLNSLRFNRGLDFGPTWEAA